MSDIKADIERYIQDMKMTWSKTTLRSEYYRLVAVAGALDGNPQTLWGLLQSKGTYTRITTWTRVCSFWNWLLYHNKQKGPNPYVQYKQQHRQCFRNGYHRVPSRFSSREINTRINRINSDDCKKTAQWIFSNGLRFSEFCTLRGSTVIGKGGRNREVFVTELQRPKNVPTYATFRRALKKVGLRPHDLRKAKLTELVERGANEFELCAIAGWNNLNTASSYIRVNEKRLKELMNEKAI